MRLKKAFNNNALLALDDNDEEVIVMGKGIAFGKKSGDLIDESLIQKKFVFDKSELNEKFSQLFDEIPQQYVELTVSIVEMAQKELDVRFDSSIYLALSDHITYAVRRYKKNENLKNALLFEGIAFGKKSGDLIDESLIQKKFVFDKSELNEKFSQLFDEIPQQYVELTVSIVEMAQKELDVRFDSSIYLALSDHITYAVRRYKKNENLKNALLFEII